MHYYCMQNGGISKGNTFHATVETQQAKGMQVSLLVKWQSDLFITDIVEHSCK